MRSVQPPGQNAIKVTREKIAHDIGMDGVSPARAVGTTVTMLTQLGLAIAAIATVYLTPTEIRTSVAEELVEVAPN